MQVSGAPENALGLEVNELPFLLFCRQGQERQQRQQGKQTLEVSWAVRGVLLEGGALFPVYLFLFCRRLAADPFAPQTSTRAVRVTPLSNPQLRMNLQGRAPLFPCSFWGATASAEGAHHFLPLVLAFGYRSATAAPAPLPLALPLLAPFPWRAVPTQRTIW